MEAGPSQVVMLTEGDTTQEKKERKPRNRTKKGKEREAVAGTIPQILPTPQKTPKTPSRPKQPVQVDESIWNWTYLTEASVTNRPPLFTLDYRYFFLISGSSVKIYSSTTGQVVSTLSPSSSGSSSSSAVRNGHSDDITAAVISPRNAFQLVTASLDGRIKIWDYLDAVLLTTLDVGEPITHLCVHHNIPDYFFVATNTQKLKGSNPNAKEQSKVYRLNYKPLKSTENAPIKTPSEKIKIGKMQTTTGLGISPSGEWLVATGGTKAYVSSTASMGGSFTKFVSNEMLSCLAFHPTEEYFATGDERGQIRLWYCLDPALMKSKGDGQERRAQTTTLHWHAHAVSSIAFSGNGAYLLSGGEEGVLVIWQLHSGKREYVPRVGAPILSVSVATHPSFEEEFLLVLNDGTLVFISSGSLRIARSFARVKHDPEAWSCASVPLAVHTLTSTVILPSSHPTSLLAFSPLTSTLVSEIEVSPSNRVSRRDDKPIEPSQVENAVISADGMWLATMDSREGDDDFERESYLKIWQWDPSSSTWNLNSRVDRPHAIHKVTTLCWATAPDYPLLLSTGEDGNVKVWKVKVVTSKKGDKEVFWVCRSVLGYRSLSPIAAVCSPDGSIFAVTFGESVIIFEMSSNAVLTTLTSPDVKRASNLAFIGRSGRYLAISSSRAVLVWDLLNTSVCWSRVMGSIRHVVPHPQQDTFIVISRSGDKKSSISKFNVSTSSPKEKRLLPFSLKRVIWSPLSSSGPDFSLVGITSDWRSVLFGDVVNIIDRDEGLPKSILKDSESQRRNLFQDLFGVSSFDDHATKTASSEELLVQPLSTFILKSTRILDSPAYLLPPLHTLYDTFVEGLLVPRAKSIVPPKAKLVIEEPEDEDVIMQSGDVTTTSHFTRTFSEEELNDFVSLFKKQTFMSSNPALPHKHSNGNGVMKSKVNGAHSNGAIVKAVINDKHEASTQKGKEPIDTSPVAIGKKRKKSMA